MSEHRAIIRWRRESAEFTYDTYNRAHDWTFDGGTTVRASSAPAYRGEPELVDPEEAFVAALSSCHMLTFLALAAKRRHVVETYEDEAVGTMAKNAEGRLAITRIDLHPRITWGGAPPTAEEVARLHAKAHEHCFVANSVRTEVTVEAAA